MNRKAKAAARLKRAEQRDNAAITAAQKKWKMQCQVVYNGKPPCKKLSVQAKRQADSGDTFWTYIQGCKKLKNQNFETAQQVVDTLGEIPDVNREASINQIETSILPAVSLSYFIYFVSFVLIIIFFFFIFVCMRLIFFVHVFHSQDFVFQFCLGLIVFNFDFEIRTIAVKKL